MSSAERPPAVIAVVLVYNQAESACRVVAAIKAQSYPLARILVVDNASPDGSGDRVAATHPDVEIIRCPVNLGVGAGHNAGWRVALADPACDLVWALEHDSVPKPTCLAELLAARQALAAGDAAPLVLFPREVGPHEGETRPMWVLRHYRLSRVRVRKPTDPPERREYFGFNGTLFPAALMRRIGWADETFFFYCEDTDYNIRCRNAGAKAYLIPAAEMEHDLLRDYRRIDLGKWLYFAPGNSSPARAYYGFRNTLVVSTRQYSKRRVYLRYAVAYCIIQLHDLLFADQRFRRIRARTVGARDALRGRMGRADYAFLRGLR
jgi:GT2 family glycosyltransferase